MEDHPPSTVLPGEQVTLFVLTPMHTAPGVAERLQLVLNHAYESLDDGRCLHDLNMAVGLSTDIDHGRKGIQHLLSYQRVDSIICFGKTCQSMGLPDAELFRMYHVRFRQQVMPIRTVRLPAIFDSGWLSEANVLLAAEAVKPLLDRDNQASKTPVTTTLDATDLN